MAGNGMLMPFMFLRMHWVLARTMRVADVYKIAPTLSLVHEERGSKEGAWCGLSVSSAMPPALRRASSMDSDALVPKQTRVSKKRPPAR